MEEKKMIKKIADFVFDVVMTKVGTFILSSLMVFLNLYVFYVAVLTSVSEDADVLLKALMILIYAMVFSSTTNYFRALKELKRINKEIETIKKVRKEYVN